MKRPTQYGRRCFICHKGLKKGMQVFTVPLDEWDNSWKETCSREHQLELIRKLPDMGEYLDTVRLARIDPEAYKLAQPIGSTDESEGK